MAFSIFLCSVFFLTSSHFAKLFVFNWKIFSVTVTWDATCRQTVGHTETFLVVSAFFEWPKSTGVTMHDPCRNLIYIYQHFKFARGYLTDNISSQICKSAWDTQVDFHRDSWKSRLLKRPNPWRNVLDSANYMSSSYMALFSNLPGCC